VDRTRINEKIQESEIRVIDENGEHLGVLPTEDALARANQAGLDLVEVATSGTPHVCRIMDYGQYKFEQAKRQREAKKKQKVIVIKEVKMRPRIDQHDYEFKMNHAQRFLEHGYKVKFTVMFRGREMAHKDRGRQVLQRVENDLLNLAFVEAKPKFEGRTLHMIVAPVAKAKKKAQSDKEPQAPEKPDATPVMQGAPETDSN